MVAQSYASQVGIGAADPVTVPLEFVSTSLSGTNELVKSSGIRGTRYRDKHRAKHTRERVSGNLILEPSITEIDALLLWVMGAEAAGVNSFTDALVKRFVTVDKVTKVFTYDECVPSRWQITGSAGQPTRWTIDIEGQSATEANSGTFPSLSIDTDSTFYMHDEITFTFNSITCTPASFTLSVDNVLDTERFFNSLTRNEIPAQDRLVTLSLELPYDTVHEPLFDLAAAGIAGSMALSDGSTSYTIAFENLKCPDPPVEVPNRSEIMLNLEFEAFGSTADSDAEFTITKA